MDEGIVNRLFKLVGGREFKVIYALAQRPRTRQELSNLTGLGKWRTEQAMNYLLIARVLERRGDYFAFTPERIDWKKLTERRLYRAPSPSKTLAR